MSEEQENKWRQVRVTFRKALSDGNYGTESAEVILEWLLDHEEKASAHHDLSIAATMLTQAREIVHAELDRSPSRTVRHALMYPPVREPNPHVMPVDEVDDDDLPL